MKVTWHPYKELRLDSELAEDEDLLHMSGDNAAVIQERKYSFVAMTWHPKLKKIIVGATNMAGDILLTFDPKTRQFESCGFPFSPFCSSATTKIHKGLSLDVENDEVYFGIATLSPLSDIIRRPGGPLLKYNFTTKEYSVVADAMPGMFNQATMVDPKRCLMYTCTGRSCFGVIDLKTRKMKAFEPVGSIPHNLAMDDEGGVWSTHSEGRQAFFRYNPDTDGFEFPEGCAFPNATEASNVMYPGAGPVDEILNGNDGFLYTASALGELYRLDPQKGSLEYLGKPFPGKRLPALAMGEDGWLYMAGGREHASFLTRYHIGVNRFELLGPVETPDGRFLNYAHELCIVDGICFIGETDNKTRSGYMWVCEV